MLHGFPRFLLVVLALVSLTSSIAACGGGSGGFLPKQYEYEEEIYLALDGTATVNVNGSVAALVALRGADFDVNPRARLDRQRVRALFTGPGVRVVSVSLSRRHGRRFVHVSVAVDDIRRLSAVAPFAWSTYRFDRKPDDVLYEQVVGRAVGKPVGDVGWNGSELVAFRMHIPSRISDNNSPEPVQRGNILRWEQPLADRLKSMPVDMVVQMQPQSILYSTLLLFGATIVAAAATFGIVLWWVARRGRDAEELHASHS
jgi:hypothetical protein